MLERQWDCIFKRLRENNHQPLILYSAIIPIRRKLGSLISTWLPLGVFSEMLLPSIVIRYKNSNTQCQSCECFKDGCKESASKGCVRGRGPWRKWRSFSGLDHSSQSWLPWSVTLATPHAPPTHHRTDCILHILCINTPLNKFYVILFLVLLI